MNRIVLVALLLVGLLTSFGLSPGTARAQGAGEPDALDLAALLLRPADLDAAGLDGYGTGVSTTGTGATIARFDDRYRGGSSAATLLDTTGVVRGSSLYLVRNDDLVLPSPDQVLTSLNQFGDDQAARSAYDAVTARRGAAANQPGSAVDVDGGEAMSFLATSSDPLGAATYRQASVVAVLGDLVAEVTIELTSAMPLTTDLAEKLFAVQARRVADATPDGSALGNRTLDITGPDIDPELSRYIRLDGEPVPESGQSADVMEGQATIFKAFGADDVFQTSYQSTDGTLTIGTYLSNHSSDDAARSYFQTIPDLLASTDGYGDVQVGNAIVPVGSAATFVTYTVDGSGAMATELIFHSGSVVVELIVNAPVTATVADMTTLGRAMETCLAGPDCAPISIPDDVAPGSGSGGAG